MGRIVVEGVWCRLCVGCGPLAWSSRRHCCWRPHVRSAPAFRYPTAFRRLPENPVPKIDTHAEGRPADQLHEWAAERALTLGIPATALEAYAYAARVAEVENPDCHLAWTTLAGIGMVESHHGTYRGATIAPNGDVRPPIRGVRLDGSMGNLQIADSDSGRLDGDPSHDRAMGPMQFIPETWRLYGVDANNDGVVSAGQHRRRGVVGRRIPLLAGQGSRDTTRMDGRPACLQPVRPICAHRTRLGDGLRRRSSALTRREGVARPRRRHHLG